MWASLSQCLSQCLSLSLSLALAWCSMERHSHSACKCSQSDAASLMHTYRCMHSCQLGVAQDPTPTLLDMTWAVCLTAVHPAAAAVYPAAMPAVVYPAAMSAWARLAAVAHLLAAMYAAIYPSVPSNPSVAVGAAGCYCARFCCECCGYSC